MACLHGVSVDTGSVAHYVDRRRFGYCLATHQSSIVVAVGLLAGLVLPQIGFDLMLYWRERAIKSVTVLMRAPHKWQLARRWRSCQFL